MIGKISSHASFIAAGKAAAKKRRFPVGSLPLCYKKRDGSRKNRRGKSSPKGGASAFPPGRETSGGMCSVAATFCTPSRELSAHPILCWAGGLVRQVKKGRDFLFLRRKSVISPIPRKEKSSPAAKQDLFLQRALKITGPASESQTHPGFGS